MSTKCYSYVFLLGVFLLGSSFQALASQGNGEQKIDLQVSNADLVEVFNTIEQQSSLVFMYGKDIAKETTRFTFAEKNITVKSVLNKLSSRAGLLFKTIGKTVYVKVEKTLPAEPKEKAVAKRIAKGKVVDANTGEPLIGASIQIKGTTEGEITDFDGAFHIEVEEGATLVVSFIGYVPQEVAVSGNKPIVVKLAPDAEQLKEIVIVGYGTQKKSDITGAVDGVTAKSFNNGVMSSPEQLFQGKVAGVRVVSSSGEPGAGIDIMVRGAGSIRSNNTPLFVVDGIPLSSDDATPGGQGGIGSSRSKNPLNFLNPADIESISVLKDASASAIYGSRGSNGVVIIKTKSGNTGKASLTIDSYVGISTVAKKLDLLTGPEFAAANPDHVYKPKVDPEVDPEVNPTADPKIHDTDWQDAIFRTAMTSSNNISFSNKMKSGGYYLSVSHLNQEGIIEESKFERLSGRFNINQSFLEDDRLKVDVNLTASQTKDNGVPTSDGNGATGELITHMLKANPTRPTHENGEPFVFATEGSYNPVYMLDFYDDRTNTLRVLGNVDARFRIVDGLLYQFKFGLDRFTSERNTTYFANATEIENVGAYYQANNKTTNYLLEHYLTLDKSFDNHNVKVLAGYSYQNFDRSGTSFAGNSLEGRKNPMYNPEVLLNAEKAASLRGFSRPDELQSLFGRLNYSYKGTYLLTATYRADGSTRFLENNKYGYFPSVALGWNIANEGFLADASFVDELKLRASWGLTGNQEVDSRAATSAFRRSPKIGYYLDGEKSAITDGIEVARTANPNLKWEVVEQMNFGLNYNFLNGKVYGSIDYFTKVTTDAIIKKASAQPNFTDIYVNMEGEIVNRGLEITIGSKLINTKDFFWSVDLNGATLDNELRDLPVSEILSGSVSGSGVSGENVNIFKSGYALGSFYLLDHQGFDGEGKSIYADEKKIIESALPKFTYGLTSYMRYKGFDLSFTITGQSGAYLFNNTKLASNVMGNLPGSKNITQDVLESGQSVQDALKVSDYFLESSDYIRLNNMRIGYTFDTQWLSWLSKLSVYVSGQNLVTITDYTGFDPAVNTSKGVSGNNSFGVDFASYPTSRSYLFGLTLNY